MTNNKCSRERNTITDTIHKVGYLLKIKDVKYRNVQYIKQTIIQQDLLTVLLVFILTILSTNYMRVLLYLQNILQAVQTSTKVTNYT